MPEKKLSREQVQKRRENLRSECRDYAPTRGGYQCQHYAGKGACARDDYFMCVVWAKRHPEQMYHLDLRDGEASTETSTATTAAHDQQPPPNEMRGKRRQVHDLEGGGAIKSEQGRHLLVKPELLTERAVEALSSLGLEVVVQTTSGGEVVIVPENTGQSRCEITFAHARTLVMILQVFPGASVKKIRSAGNKETS